MAAKASRIGRPRRSRPAGTPLSSPCSEPVSSDAQSLTCQHNRISTPIAVNTNGRFASPTVPISSGPPMAPSPKTALRMLSLIALRSPNPLAKAVFSSTTRPPKPVPATSAVISSIGHEAANPISTAAQPMIDTSTLIDRRGGNLRAAIPKVRVDSSEPALNTLMSSLPDVGPSW